MFSCVRNYDVVSFYDFPIGFWNCSDIVVFVLHSLRGKET